MNLRCGLNVGRWRVEMDRPTAEQCGHVRGRGHWKHRDASQWSNDAHWLSVVNISHETSCSWPLPLYLPSAFAASRISIVLCGIVVGVTSVNNQIPLRSL